MGAATLPAGGSLDPRGAQAAWTSHLVVTVAVALPGCLRCWWAFDPAPWEPATELLVLGAVAWCLVSWRVASGTLFHPYALFLVSLSAFHAGQVCVSRLDPAVPMLKGAYTAAELAAALYFVTLCLLGLHAGALAGLLHSARRAGRPLPRWPELEPELRLVGWVLIAISFLPLMFYLKDCLVEARRSGYHTMMMVKNATATTGAGAIGKRLMMFFVPAALMVIAATRDRRRERNLAAGLLAGTLVILLLTGWRSVSFGPALGLLWLWHHAHGRLRLGRWALLGAVLVLVVFPAIGILRGLASVGVAVSPKMLANLASPVRFLLAQVGENLINVVQTMELVPAHRPHLWGAGYLWSLLIVFPNWTGGVHPAQQAVAFEAYTQSTLRPFFYAQGLGNGYSVLAEAYFNFGWIGAPLFLAFCGWLLVRVVAWAELAGNTLGLAAVSATMYQLLLLPRAQFSDLVRGVSWFVGLPLAAALWLHWQRVRATALLREPAPTLGEVHG